MKDAENLRVAYKQICQAHHGIADFRAKLLALLPIASGAGLFLVLTGDKLPSEVVRLLLPAGVFGVLVTAGLFFYELRGIQKCNAWIACARELERELLGRVADYGAFRFRPKGVAGVGATGAALVIYPAVMGAWALLAGLGAAGSLHDRGAAIRLGIIVTAAAWVFGMAVNRAQTAKLKAKKDELKEKKKKTEG